jgi:hypothetical protein
VTAAGLTTATPGLQVQMNAVSGVNVQWFNRLRASGTAETNALLGNFQEFLPDSNTPLFLQIRALNGTVAPAAQSWTISSISVEDTIVNPVQLLTYSPSSALPVQVPASVTVAQATGTNLNAVVAQATAANLNATATLAVGANLAGDVGLQVRASATGAATFANVFSPATPAGQNVKGTAGRLFSGNFTNAAVTSRFIKFFNAAAVTPGTTAANYQIEIRAGQTIEFSVPAGIGHGTGIFIMVTGAVALADNTAITLNDVTGFVTFA